MGGTGATAYWICQEAIRNTRRQIAKMRAQVDLRRATRRAMPGRDARDHHAFACARLCLTCGWLEPPVVGADPMRCDPSHPTERPCPRCAELAWADLSDVEDAHAIAEGEHADRATRADLFRSALIRVPIVATLGSIAAVSLLRGHALPMIVVIALSAVLFAMTSARRFVAALSTGRATARRWHGPARRIAPGKVLARGVVAGNPSLRSPLGGRPGLAWRIEVRYPHDRGDAFALVEQAARHLSVDGVALDREPSLAIPAVRVAADAPHVRAFLLARGIEIHDAPIVTEAVLEDGADVVLRRDRRGGAPVLAAR